MNPIPLLDAARLVGWRLDAERHAASWSSGVGAGLVGGRWNSPGHDVVYASLDPSTAILEVAVHKGFAILDTRPHVLTAFELPEPSRIRVVRPTEVPNPNWLRPGTPTEGQQAFGDALLREHGLVAIPSVVSTHAWNLVAVAQVLTASCTSVVQEPFALDPRLAPGPRPTAN